jgi:hypothetical protein
VSEIKLTFDDPKLFARRLRVAANEYGVSNGEGLGSALREAADQIEAQLPKAPVEEPTESWALVRAIADQIEAHLSKAPKPAPSRTEAVAAGECSTCHAPVGYPHDEACFGASILDGSPAEAVEADKAPPLCQSISPQFPNPRCLREAGHSGDHEAPDKNGEEWMDWPEPSPVQVEAEPVCKRCGEQDCNDCWPSGLVAGTGYLKSVLAAPAEDDPIEALLNNLGGMSLIGLGGLSREALRGHLRAFTARVLEVGGQQPGVPAIDREALAVALHDDACPDRTCSPVAMVEYYAKADEFIRILALLPEEPTS